MKPIDQLTFDLSEISEAVGFVSKSISIRNRLSRLVRDGPIDPEIQGIIDALRRTADQDYQVLSNCLLVSAWGSFENYIRMLLPFVAKIINDQGLHRTSIKEVLISKNIELTANALLESIGGSKLFTFDNHALASNLAMTLQKGGLVKLNHDAYGLIGGKFSLKDLVTYLSWLDFEIRWDDIGRSLEIQRIFGVENMTSAGKKSKEFLVKIVNDRNKIAHQGGNSLVLDRTIPEIVKFLIEFSKQLDINILKHANQIAVKAS